MGRNHRIVVMIPKLCLLLGCAALAWGRSRQKVFPYEYSQEDLPNGLRLITVPTDYANIVAVYIVVQTGSRNEVEAGHTGFAHLFEHLMFRGTEKYPPQKFNQTLNRIGAASNASTSDDFTVLLHHVLQGRPGNRAGHGGRPLPAPEVRRTRVQDRDPGRAGRVQQEQRLAVQQALRSDSSDTAFDRHTYKHTTMGFLKDIQDMPNQYEYSLKFFDRYYRPEYTTILVVGDVKPRPYARWWTNTGARGSAAAYKPEIPVEPPQEGPRTAHVDWPSPTLPIVAVAFKGPAYNDATQADGGPRRAGVPGLLQHVGPLPEAGGTGAEGRRHFAGGRRKASTRPCFRSRRA